MIGPNSRTTSRVGADRKRATSSDFRMARVLGSTSANTSTSTVMVAVAAATPHGPGMAAVSTWVARAEARMLTRLLPSSTAPIIVSWSDSSLLTRLAGLSPSRSSWCIRARLAAVSEVSAAENRAEIASRAMTMGARPSRAVIMGLSTAWAGC
jgi:hypothetical protein